MHVFTILGNIEKELYDQRKFRKASGTSSKFAPQINAISKSDYEVKPTKTYDFWLTSMAFN